MSSPYPVGARVGVRLEADQVGEGTILMVQEPEPQQYMYVVYITAPNDVAGRRLTLAHADVFGPQPAPPPEWLRELADAIATALEVYGQTVPEGHPLHGARARHYLPGRISVAAGEQVAKLELDAMPMFYPATLGGEL